ncbi:MAG: single-stranded-DNA-specific exonuclease RecJ [Candidatus Saccharibacteria bacterium]|nr:single-stranded-DNA-specific exonuclease RecJ [Candidatus Saccharibacteria bacterium]
MITTQAEIIEILLKNRQVTNRGEFFAPDYQQVLTRHDPFGMVDMDKAVSRLVKAKEGQQKIVIFGDYDADGVTSTALLLDALASFGFKNVDFYLPDRFTNGYGLTITAIEDIVTKNKPDLIITVDCGSLNHAEITRANELGVDVIVTDHHNLAEIQPSAVAVINPKRPENNYPNRNLAGVGTAFTLVRALQTVLTGLENGREKWLLDLVAIGTIADLMELTGENRVLVKFGLIVLNKTRRLGLKHLLDKNKLESVTSETIGFIIGPRLNAAGRLERADLALEVLTASDLAEADARVEKLDFLNTKRRALQNKVYTEAREQAMKNNDAVLVLSGDNWHEGVVGIAASHIEEEFQKPVFLLSKKNDVSKGSARSFGDFSVFEAIEYCRPLLKTGGGHKAAGGLSLATENFDIFRQRVNEFYTSLNLTNQLQYFEPKIEIELANFNLLTDDLYQQIQQFEPFGVGNPEPIFRVKNLKIQQVILLGTENQHLKLYLSDANNKSFEMIRFNYNQDWKNRLDDKVDVIFTLSVNYWNGQSKLQGRLLSLQTSQ